MSPLNPLDLLSDAKKDRLIDASLTRVADVAENAGATHLAQALRNLRNDTPFTEDVANGLQKALEAFAEKWSVNDPGLVLAMQESSLWDSTELLSDLASILLRPAEIRGPEFDRIRELLAGASPEAMGDRITAALVWLIDEARRQLFTHPKLQGVHALYLHAQSVDRQGEILEELRALHRDIAPQLTSPDRQAIDSSIGRPAVLESAPRAAGPTVRVSPDLALPLPDVLTPSLRNSALVAASYAPAVGEEAARWLEGIQADVTASIESADFVSQEKIAERLLREDFGMRSLKASGYYMLGEAKRLQADFVDGQSERDHLLDAASDAYSTAADLDPASARSQRGLGRVHEVRGDLEKALKQYAKARASALNAFEASGDSPSSDAAHEVLRSTRHYASCLAQRIRVDQKGAAARDSSLRQLHGLTLESDELHRSILPKFAAQAGWTFIEWFMGLVLLAKSYAVVHDDQRAWLSMLYALDARMGMMDPSRTSFSAVERGNLRWWCSTAKTVSVNDRNFQDGVERLTESVAANDVGAAWINMQDLVWPVRSPWSQNLGRTAS